MRAKAPQTSRPLRRRGVMPPQNWSLSSIRNKLALVTTLCPGGNGRVRTELHQLGRPGSRASCTHPAATRPQDCPAAPKRSPLPPPAGSSPRVESNDSMDRSRVGPGEALPGSRLPSSAGAYLPPAVFAPKVRAPRGRLPSGLAKPPPGSRAPLAVAFGRSPVPHPPCTTRKWGWVSAQPTPPVAHPTLRNPAQRSPIPAG